MKTTIKFNGQSILITTCEFTGISSIQGTALFAGRQVIYVRTFKSFRTAKKYVKSLLSFQEVSQEAKTDVTRLRREVKKSKPNSTKIFEMLSGTKYTGELIHPDTEAIQEEMINEKILNSIQLKSTYYIMIYKNPNNGIKKRYYLGNSPFFTDLNTLHAYAKKRNVLKYEVKEEKQWIDNNGIVHENRK